ncbi:hypothetical protein ACROYT_G022578 [Oculina patagonica]
MTTTCDNLHCKRDVRWAEEDSRIVEYVAATTPAAATVTSASTSTATATATSTADELKEIYGKGEDRNISGFQESESSEEEEEEISVEKLKKTKGWKLLMKSSDSKKEKKH